MCCVRDGRAYGVVLANGDELYARVVASNLDPKLTFLKLLDPKLLDPEFRASVEHFRVEGTSLKMNLALDGLPDFTALPGTPGPQHGATMHICPFDRLCGARPGMTRSTGGLRGIRCSR